MKLAFPKKIEVRNSKLYGRGVFAKENISKGEVLEECHYISICDSKENSRKIDLNLKQYLFGIKNEKKKDSIHYCILFGFGPSFNHKNKNNASFEFNKERNVFTFLSKEDISKDEEIFVNYMGEDDKFSEELGNELIASFKESKNYNTDLNLFLNQKIEVRDSNISGRGIFATEDIKFGEILEECHHVVLDCQFKKLEQKIKEYVFTWPYKKSENDERQSYSSVVFGTGSIYNHSKNNNADWVVDKNRNVFTFFAKSNIKKDEEICTNYGDGYLKHVGTNIK